MPKMKTNSGARKRFKESASGKIRRKSAFHNHILTKKSKKRKKRLGKVVNVHPADEDRVKAMI